MTEPCSSVKMHQVAKQEFDKKHDGMSVYQSKEMCGVELEKDLLLL